MITCDTGGLAKNDQDIIFKIGGVFMFEAARECSCTDENNAEELHDRIIELLKEHKMSLSQTRALFHWIVNTLEDTPLK